jgi:hypothetical protein
VPRFTPQPVEDTNATPEQLLSLQNLGVQSRDPTYQELVDYLTGGTIYNDIPLGTSAEDHYVTRNRVSGKVLASVLDIYNQIFYTTADGRPTTDNQSEQVKGLFADARTAYIAAHGEAMLTPQSLAAFITTDPGQKAASRDLTLFGELFSRMENLGLNSGELENARGYILSQVTPTGMNIPTLAATINAGPGAGR